MSQSPRRLSRFSRPARPTPPPPARRPQRWRELADLLQSIAQVALIFAIITAVIGRFEIQQTSMEPNFHAGQRVFVSQLGSALPAWLVSSAHAASGSGATPFDLRRGQVVVFYRTAARDETPLIKRLIGLPGETLEIRDGAVLVNGAPLDEPYARDVYTGCESFCGPLTLGADEYFFMGDNRPVSFDSRSFGPIPEAQIVGRVIVRFWPLDQLALFL